MLDVTMIYGPQGCSGSGDAYVADLLKRTVEGQPAAVAAFDTRLAQLLTDGSLVHAHLPTMAVTHTEWLAALHWQLATLYLDANVQARDVDEATFVKSVYPTGDTLCDAAAYWSRLATQTRSALVHKAKVRLTQVAELPQFPINLYTYQGVWAIFNWVALQAASYVSLFERSGNVPARFVPLYREIYRLVHSHVGAMSELRKDFNSTMITANALDVLVQAVPHVQALNSLVQHLWAPYLFGQRYTDALRRQLTLEELNLGVDPWVLTDPEAAMQRGRDTASRNELAAFWSTVSDIPATIRLAQQVRELDDKDVLRRRTGRAYQVVPWPAQFLVRTPAVLCGRQFVPGDLVAYFVRGGATGATVEIRKTGHLVQPIDLLGQRPAE